MNRAVIQYCIDQLTALQDNLDKTEKLNQFNMNYWARGNDITVHDNKTVELDCGFAGCFMGWAVHQKWFEPFGWTGVFTIRPGQPNTADLSRLVVDLKMVRGEHRSESVSVALMQIFGLDYETTAETIVLPEYYEGDNATPLEVAERLQKLLDHGEYYLLNNYKEPVDGPEDP